MTYISYSKFRCWIRYFNVLVSISKLFIPTHTPRVCCSLYLWENHMFNHHHSIKQLIDLTFLSVVVAVSVAFELEHPIINSYNSLPVIKRKWDTLRISAVPYCIYDNPQCCIDWGNSTRRTLNIHFRANFIG